MEILKNQRVFDRGKGELENAKGLEHESIENLQFLECFQTYFLPQGKQSTILLTRKRCRKFNISSGDRTYSVKVEKPSEPTGTFQICFWYFISFSMKTFFLKIFKTKQRLLLTCKYLHDIDFEKTTT